VGASCALAGLVLAGCSTPSAPERISVRHQTEPVRVWQDSQTRSTVVESAPVRGLRSPEWRLTLQAWRPEIGGRAEYRLAIEAPESVSAMVPQAFDDYGQPLRLRASAKNAESSSRFEAVVERGYVGLLARQPTRVLLGKGDATVTFSIDTNSVAVFLQKCDETFGVPRVVNDLTR
jgi:hypothetical protein